MKVKTNVDPNASPTLTTAVEAANTAVVITLSADANAFHVLDWIAWSYDGTPTGSLTVSINGTDVFSVDITVSGPGFFRFDDMPIYDTTFNQAVVITLAAGGAGVIGKLNTRHR